MARSVAISFTWPYFKLVFNDSTAPAHPELDNHPGTVEQGRIQLDISHDCGFVNAGVIIAGATQMWSQGASFQSVWHKYNDF